MLGLKRGVVLLADYDAAWALAFEQEAAVFRRSVGELVVDIQHVGSTAVPGSVAKPILDVALAVTSRAIIPELARRLAVEGFEDRGDAGGEGGYLLVRNAERDVRITHVHIIECDDPQWTAYLVFRDALRSNSRLRGEYTALKKRLAEEHPADRDAYTRGKRPFIERVLAEQQSAARREQRSVKR